MNFIQKIFRDHDLSKSTRSILGNSVMVLALQYQEHQTLLQFQYSRLDQFLVLHQFETHFFEVLAMKLPGPTGAGPPAVMPRANKTRFGLPAPGMPRGVDIISVASRTQPFPSLSRYKAELLKVYIPNVTHRFRRRHCTQQPGQIGE